MQESYILYAGELCERNEEIIVEIVCESLVLENSNELIIYCMFKEYYILVKNMFITAYLRIS